MCVNDKWKNNSDIPFIVHCFVVFIFSHSRWQELSYFFTYITLHAQTTCICCKLNYTPTIHYGIGSCLLRQVKNVDITTIQNKQTVASSIMNTWNVM